MLKFSLGILFVVSLMVKADVVRDTGTGIVIDGKSSTIGLTSAAYLAGYITEPFSTVFGSMVNVLSPAEPEEDIDYFGLIEEDVKRVVGNYINDHNMQQIEYYKKDLATLMNRYNEAPDASDTYPDKNTMANSLSTSIVANRFLLEADVYPHSLMLHYADISSIHIMVLKDAADTYTKLGQVPSYWWVDLDSELEHYITYGRELQNSVVDWRNDLVECTMSDCVKNGEENKPKTCFDVWTITDSVAEITDSCTAVSGDSSCDDHCQAYQVAMNREVSQMVYEYLGKVIHEWQALKLLSAQMAQRVLGDN